MDRNDAQSQLSVQVSFDPRTQKHRAISADIPGLDVSDMNLERLFRKVIQAAPDLLKAAGKPAGNFNLNFEKAEPGPEPCPAGQHVEGADHQPGQHPEEQHDEEG